MEAPSGSVLQTRANTTRWYRYVGTVLLDAARVQTGEALLESRQPPRSYVHLGPMLEI